MEKAAGGILAFELNFLPENPEFTRFTNTATITGSGLQNSLVSPPGDASKMANNKKKVMR